MNLKDRNTKLPKHPECPISYLPKELLFKIIEDIVRMERLEASYSKLASIVTNDL